jgi:hypothetical protein
MNEPWITILSAALVGLGVLAELNLLRIFLHDWRESRREELARPSHARPRRRATETAPPQWHPGRHWLAACLVALALSAPVARAQEPAVTGQPTTTPAATNQPEAPTEPPQTTGRHLLRSAEDTKSPFGLQINIDYTTAYFYHGIIQEDTGFILQPAAKLTINLYEQDDFKVDALLGTWNSFHGQKTGAQTHGDFTDYWYESDLIAGFVLTKGKWSLTSCYTFLTSPSDAYQTVQELDLTVAYDDSDLLGKLALHPYVLLGMETGADASDGAASNTGTYLELGIAPGFSVDVGKTPVAISCPASVGLSLHDYYQNAAGEDDTFGFAQVGVKASVPLPFGDRYGKWTLNAGVAALFLGDHTAEFNGGDHEQLIGTIGLQLNF